MQRTLIAAAVLAAASGSVLAAPQKVHLFSATLVGEEIGVEGMVGPFGCVHVSSTAGAVINNNQSVTVNASLDPQAQTFTTGHMTTTANNNTSSIKDGGAAFLVTSQSHSSSASASQGFEASASYRYGNQSAAVAGGGYKYSPQAAAVEGGFTHTSQNSGGHISAGGSIGGGDSYQNHVTPTSGRGSFHAGGVFQAGYHESGYASTSAAAGAFQASEGSGNARVWGYHANEGSGFAKVDEDSSGYEKSRSSSSDAYRAAGGVDASLATTDKNATGTIGVNIAGGAGNLQHNGLAIAALNSDQ